MPSLHDTSTHALPIAGGLGGAAIRNLLPVMTLRFMMPRGGIRNALWLLEDVTSWRAIFMDVTA